MSIYVETSRQMTSVKLIAEKYGEHEANGKCREWNQTGPMTCGGPDAAINGLTYVCIRPDSGGGLILVPQGGRLEIYCG